MPETQREFRPETYLAAAQEHMPVAVELDSHKEYTLAHYVAGLAVECILRAYKSRVDPVLDERHDLQLIAKNGRFLDLASGERLQRAIAALGELVTRWDNAHRYRGEAAVRKFLNARRLYARKGDVLEQSSAKIVNAAIELVSLGVQRWKR